ncbi:unnamed protein product [Arctia plantaginis]|uniref:Uncharacterized protein n=1 Tax=Arctia plantaginis TaxID=874455 RepID=A0A8S0YP10_ARCPL|nr:unnamed protein product [Arctia plantaginis]CAB3243610.1 unnamed protein product [Arctia plantaginis]
MKSFIAFTALLAIASAQLGRPQAAAPRVASDERNAKILRYDNEIGPDGSFSYVLETDNGISAQAQGTPRDFGGNPPIIPVVIQGGFAWSSPDGKPVSISYEADENGYRAFGDAIPTSPPIPAYIARAVEYLTKLQKKK